MTTQRDFNIRYIQGDVTRPIGAGPRVIAHVCNDIGGWGRGFVKALSARWPQPEEQYRAWHRQPSQLPFELGQVQFVQVEPELWVANMIGQHDIARQGTTSDGLPPIRYEAIGQALAHVADFAQEHGASVHMPRIGCGLAGGRWELIEPLIQQALVCRGILVIVYDLAEQT